MEQKLGGPRSALPERWDETYDVVVVGSGFAGLAAASEAAKHGAKVLILEKMSHYGGNSVLAGGGYSCWDSKLKLREKLGLGEDSWQLHREDTLKGGGYYNDPALVEVLAKQAPAGLDWLVDAGATFRETLPQIGGHSACRSYQAGCNLAEVAKKHVLSLGVELRLNAAVTAICRDGDGPVAGVRVLQEGEEKTVAARAGVILASGGFAQDVALRTAHQPSLVAAYSCSNHKGATGEIIRYARAVGADVLHMEFIQLYPCADPKSGGVDKYAFDAYSGTGYGTFYVNRAGRRFVNELLGRDVVSNIQVAAGEKPTYAVLNRAIFEKMTRTAEELQKGVAIGRLSKGDTVRELAQAVGLPADAFEETVARHNEAVYSGADPEFGKTITKQMIPLDEGPFYAIAQWPAVHYTMGGLRINTGAQVLDIWGEAIPGLFAAGEVCGGLHGSNRLAGNAIAECVVFGRIAGARAAGSEV